LVIDHNTKDNQDITFKYYLGESRKKKFKVIVDTYKGFPSKLGQLVISRD